MQPLEARLMVSKVQDTHAKDDSVMVTLKGVTTVVMRTSDGYQYEDEAEISVTVKVHRMAVAKALGIDEYENSRVLVLRDQDLSLQNFEVEMEEPVPGTLEVYQQEIA